MAESTRKTGSDQTYSLLDVRQSIAGFIRASHSSLKLSYHRNANVVVRTDAHQLRGVKLVSGGGAGHEPAQPGYVGRGI